LLDVAGGESTETAEGHRHLVDSVRAERATAVRRGLRSGYRPLTGQEREAAQPGPRRACTRNASSSERRNSSNRSVTSTGSDTPRTGTRGTCRINSAAEKTGLRERLEARRRPPRSATRRGDRARRVPPADQDEKEPRGVTYATSSPAGSPPITSTRSGVRGIEQTAWRGGPRSGSGRPAVC
jgi:hypothetical protein